MIKKIRIDRHMFCMSSSVSTDYTVHNFNTFPFSTKKYIVIFMKRNFSQNGIYLV